MTHQYPSPQDIALRIEQLCQTKEKMLTDPELQIIFDAKATAKASEIFKKSGFSHQRPQLRVYIEGKGCDGFYYGVAFDDVSERDFICRTPDLDIIIDPDSLIFLYGSKVTWSQVDNSEGFLVENPHHERFRGKFFKKSAWKNTLQGRSHT
jgi:iron-sulfur cluster assembly accessory protein